MLISQNTINDWIKFPDDCVNSSSMSTLKIYKNVQMSGTVILSYFSRWETVGLTVTKTFLVHTASSLVQSYLQQYSTVQYSTVQYSTVQYSTVQYSTVQYSTVQM